MHDSSDLCCGYLLQGVCIKNSIKQSMSIAEVEIEVSRLLKSWLIMVMRILSSSVELWTGTAKLRSNVALFLLYTV